MILSTDRYMRLYRDSLILAHLEYKGIYGKGALEAEDWQEIDDVCATERTIFGELAPATDGLVSKSYVDRTI